MSDVFGSKRAKPSSQQGTQTEGQRTQASGLEHHVEFDNEAGGMILTLPPHLGKYREELLEDIQYEFFLATPDETTVGSISEYIENWLARKKAQESGR